VIGVRTAASALVVAAALSACGAAPTAPAIHRDVEPVETLAPLPRVQPAVPTERAHPEYLERSYRAPAPGRRSGQRAGTLGIPSLRLVAPVDAVGLDRGVMAIPTSPARIGWLRTTAVAGDRIGASVLSGHVSDSHDAPGVLSRLRSIRRGAVITWTTARGVRHRFVVTGTSRYPRTRGVPARLFRVDGPHVLHLVTCTARVSTASGGFHYTANLVVTAREVSD
jgi:hypothetical protein